MQNYLVLRMKLYFYSSMLENPTNTELSTTMGLKYPLKKFDSQWAFGMILLQYLVKIAIYGTMHHVRCLAT